MSNLSGCPFSWRIENSPSNQGILQQSDLIINFTDAPVETWEFDFRYFRSQYDDNDERSSRIFPGYALNTWGRLAMRDIPNSYKYTLVTSSKIFYDSLVRRYPKNLDINISIMLLNIENFQILKEEYVAYHHDANIDWLDTLRLADKGEY